MEQRRAPEGSGGEVRRALQAAPRQSFWRLLLRSVRLRCPLCGRGRLFRGWVKMNPSCESCGTAFEREAGFFLGSIYFNYGLTALIVAVVYPVLLFSRLVEETVLLGGALAFVIVFPLWFFRYARALWLGFDQYWDPRPGRGTEAHDGHVP